MRSLLPSFQIEVSMPSPQKKLEGLRKDVDTEVDPIFAVNAVDILFEILVLEKEQEPYQDVVNTLVKVLDTFLALGQFVNATDLLKRASSPS